MYVKSHCFVPFAKSIIFFPDTNDNSHCWSCFNFPILQLLCECKTKKFSVASISGNSVGDIPDCTGVHIRPEQRRQTGISAAPARRTSDSIPLYCAIGNMRMLFSGWILCV